jgi:hypothetical protein
MFDIPSQTKAPFPIQKIAVVLVYLKVDDGDSLVLDRYYTRFLTDSNVDAGAMLHSLHCLNCCLPTKNLPGDFPCTGRGSCPRTGPGILADAPALCFRLLRLTHIWPAVRRRCGLLSSHGKRRKSGQYAFHTSVPCVSLLSISRVFLAAKFKLLTNFCFHSNSIDASCSNVVLDAGQLVMMHAEWPEGLHVLSRAFTKIISHSHISCSFPRYFSTRKLS